MALSNLWYLTVSCVFVAEVVCVDTEGYLKVFGGKTPLATTEEVLLDDAELTIVAAFALELLNFTVEWSVSSVLGTDRAFTSSRFSTTNPISGPARYLIFRLQ